MMRRWTVLVLLILVLPVQIVRADALPTFGDVVKGVAKVTVKGVPGPVVAVDSAWTVLVGGDEDTTVPGAFVMARAFGKGRVAAIGHEGFLRDESIRLADNQTLALNLLTWLRPQGRKGLVFTSGHREWLVASQSTEFGRAAERMGLVRRSAPEPFTRESLKDQAVVVVGNAWQPFSDGELRMLREFVDQGGGLLLLGLGWSWPSATRSESDYPMNALGAQFGVRWPNVAVFDTTDQLEGNILFHTFYPAAAGVGGFGWLEQLCREHPTDLPEFLQKDQLAAWQISKAIGAIDQAVRSNVSPEVQREISSRSLALAQQCPQFFTAAPPLNVAKFPTMAAARKQFLGAWGFAAAGDRSGQQAFARAAGLEGARLEIWNKFGILVHDDGALDDGQLAVVQNVLRLIPRSLHRLRRIIVSAADQPAYAEGNGEVISIFDYDPGQYTENAMPADTAPMIVDIFSSALVHEINHAIDMHTVAGSKALRARSESLLTSAGTVEKEFVRSMFGPKFFAEHPAEFIASLSNAWSANSFRVLALSLQRFDQGYKQPINQALFMAELYAQGGDHTFFYVNTAGGQLQRVEVPVVRDKEGRIVQLTVAGTGYRFTLNKTGDVTGYTTR